MTTNLKKSIPHKSANIDVTTRTAADILQMRADGRLVPRAVLRSAGRLRIYGRTAYTFVGYLDGGTLWRAPNDVLWKVNNGCCRPYLVSMTCAHCGKPAMYHDGGRFECADCWIPF